MLHLQTLAQALQYSLAITQLKKDEDTIRAGENSYFIVGASQFEQTGLIIDFVNRALEATRCNAISPWLTRTLYTTPILLTVEKMRKYLPHDISFSVNLVFDNLTNVYQAAAVVSSVALLFFGHTVFGASSLFVLGIGYVDRTGSLPLEWRLRWQSCAGPLSTGLNLVLGNRITQFFAVCSLGAAYLIHRNESYRARSNPSYTLVPNPVTLEQARRILYGRISPEINRSYIYHRPIPETPNIDLQVLIDLFNATDWTPANCRALRAKLTIDGQFLATHSDPLLVTDADMIVFAKENLAEFVHSVKERRVLVGEPVSYERFDAYLKIIAQYLTRQDPTTQTDALLRLAVEGGRYCGPGKFEVAESIYALVSDESDSTSFVNIITHYLHSHRSRWFMNEIVHTNPVIQAYGEIGLMDGQDVHTVHAMVNAYGRFLGVYSEAAANDLVAEMPALFLFISDFFLKDMFLTNFWNEHPAIKFVDQIQEGLASKAIPKNRVYDFLLEWIQITSFPSEECKEGWLESLRGGEFNRIPVDTNGVIHPRILAFMLVHMGVLQLIP
ncbi:MAG: hypothetical protein WCG14_06560 [Chlamydiia bacterium]